MGTYLEWAKPESESDYNKVRIWRSTTEEGTYSLLHTQSISDNSYYDMDGTTSMWYKITFYASTTEKESSYSDPLKGGTISGYCTPNDIRDITNLKAADITDTELYKIINFAANQLNSDINTYKEDEKLEYISQEKENTIDDSNTSYYIKNYPIGDSTGNQEVSTADIEVYSLKNSDGTKASVDITSISPNTGKFVVTTAISADYTLYVTYRFAPLSVSDPHPLIRTACTLLSAAWAYSKINIGKATAFSVGSMNISRHIKSFDIYYQRYQEVLKEVNNRITRVEETPDRM